MTANKKKEVRALLNALFLIGFIAAFIVYFASTDRKVFLIICGISIVVKLAEYAIRFFVHPKD
jgi:hypothetical protein